MSGTVMLRALALVILAVAASPARGEDDAMRTIYASVENTLRREYDELLRTYEGRWKEIKDEARQTIVTVSFVHPLHLLC